jgi:oxepin-CoA hydrolase/3-oxo-5,6-dehydrosuberyl-CoA semialdehyde dehydrogenase
LSKIIKGYTICRQREPLPTGATVRILESHVQGTWHAPSVEGVVTRHAVTGRPVATVSSDGIDFGAIAAYARDVGGPTLRSMTFHERAVVCNN